MTPPPDDHPALARRAALNPYLFGAALMLQRLRWDLDPESWRSRRRLRRWRDRYPGGHAVILCNGPSLLAVDFDRLARSGVFCFGLNKINLLFDRTAFRPSCVVGVNPFVLEQNADFFNATELPLFLDAVGRRWVRRRDNVAFLHSTEMSRFARDCSVSVHQGYTVTFVALQLAFHMGFRQVALVGADHRFATPGPANMTVTAGAVDESHFAPEYFSGGMRWQLPDLFQSEVAYTLARDTFDAAGGRVWNATAGGALEVFPRCDLGRFLDDAARFRSDR